MEKEGSKKEGEAIFKRTLYLVDAERHFGLSVVTSILVQVDRISTIIPDIKFLIINEPFCKKEFNSIPCLKTQIIKGMLGMLKVQRKSLKHHLLTEEQQLGSILLFRWAAVVALGCVNVLLVQINVEIVY